MLRSWDFQFFEQLTNKEKTIYLITTILGVFLLVGYIFYLLKQFGSTKPIIGLDDFIVLGLILFLLSKSFSTKIKGVKKSQTVYQQPQYREAAQLTEQLEKTLLQSYKAFLIIGGVLVIFALLFLGIFYFWLNPFDPPLNDYLEPVKSCGPPRNPRVIYMQPSKFDFVEPNTEITIGFNDNMNASTLNYDTVRICTRFAESFKLDAVPCKPISIQGIQPQFLYSEENRELIITLPKGQIWGVSQGVDNTQVDIVVTNKVKSICGFPLVDEYFSNFELKETYNNNQNFPPVDTNQLQSMEKSDLEIESFTIKDENGFLIGQGTLKNQSGQVLNNVYIKYELIADGETIRSGKTKLKNQGLYGVMYIGENLPFEVRFGETVDYDDYVVETYIDF